jgi:hypothetical protein
MGTYSVRYRVSDECDVDNAIDWNWHVKGEWSRSQRDGGSNPWLPEQGFDAEAYQALLEHFGLEQWTDEFPQERLLVTSPSELAQARRKKEDEHKLPRKTMMSDTAGYHAEAEDHTSRREGKTVTIKFEKSRWVQTRRDSETYPDPMIVIPPIGTLPTSVLDPEFASVPPHKGNLHSFGAHGEEEHSVLRPVVRLEYSAEGGWENRGCILLWVEERGEWIAILSGSWVEMVYEDESHSGPYALDETAARKILEAYGIPEGRIPLDTVHQTSPQALEEWHLQGQRA